MIFEEERKSQYFSGPGKHISLLTTAFSGIQVPAEAERETLTADFQVRRLRILPDGAACCAEVLAGVCVLHVLEREGGQASVTPHQHVSVRTLNRENMGLIQKNVTRRERRVHTAHLHVRCMECLFCGQSFTSKITSWLYVDLKQRSLESLINEYNLLCKET